MRICRKNRTIFRTIFRTTFFRTTQNRTILYSYDFCTKKSYDFLYDFFTRLKIQILVLSGLKNRTIFRTIFRTIYCTIFRTIFRTIFVRFFIQYYPLNTLGVMSRASKACMCVCLFCIVGVSGGIAVSIRFCIQTGEFLR